MFEEDITEEEKGIKVLSIEKETEEEAAVV